MNRQVLIVGGTGFIGSEISKEFLRLGDEVTLFHRNLSKGAHKNSNVVHLLGDRANPPAELKRRNFDVVIDTCGFRPSEFQILDSLVTQHYIFVSSVAVFSKNIPQFAIESAPKIDEDGLDLSSDYANLDKHQRYGILKLACEKHVRSHFGNSSIVRPSVVLGKNENSGRLAHLYNLPKIDASIPLNSERRFQFIDVSDLASLMTRVAENNPGKDYNLVGPSLSWHEFVQTFSAVFKIKNFIAGENETEFPFWDAYPNTGIRSLTSNFSWISQYEFKNLTKSLLQFKSNYTSSIL